MEHPMMLSKYQDHQDFFSPCYYSLLPSPQVSQSSIPEIIKMQCCRGRVKYYHKNQVMKAKGRSSSRKKKGTDQNAKGGAGLFFHH